MKRRTPLATLVGAVPGALPPLIGWTAAHGGLSVGGVALFAIVFLWQIPHFMAIAWMYRDDYAKAGFPMLPVIEPDGRRAGRQAVVYAAALLVASTLADAGRASAARRISATALALGVALLAWLAASVRDRAHGCSGAAAVLRLDHLPAAALDRDDRRPTVTVHDLPAVNATPQRARRRPAARRLRADSRAPHPARTAACMIAAFATSSLFLVCYIVYHAQVGSVPFTAPGPRAPAVLHDSHHTRHARGGNPAAGARHAVARPEGAVSRNTAASPAGRCRSGCTCR